MSCTACDRFRPGPARRRWRLSRIAYVADAIRRAVWAGILSGFAAYGAALTGRRLDQAPARWTEGDLDTLLSIPAPTSPSQRKPVP